jgi:hypothetical protein
VRDQLGARQSRHDQSVTRLESLAGVAPAPPS